MPSKTVWATYHSVLTANESRVCDAILRFIEKRANAQRSNVRLHDHHQDPNRRVELTAEIGTQLYAVEHTLVEPFADFMRINRDAPRLFDPIIADAASAITSNTVIELEIPLGALTTLPNKQLKPIQDALARFIIDTAPSTPIRRYASYIGDIGPRIVPGVPFSVYLHRFDALGTPARIQLKHRFAGTKKEREALRAQRIRLACDKKFPKLAAWKASDGARTILILEDNDIQLTNEGLVANAYLPIAKARHDSPDETYMIFTYGNADWYVWPMLIDGLTYFDLAARYHPIHLEFDSATLVPITDR